MPLTDSSPDPERGAWNSVRAGWRHRYGGFREIGVSIEAHDFTTPSELDWGLSFHEESVELCLNFEGRGQLFLGRNETEVTTNAASLYAPAAEGALVAWRGAGERHRFITIELSRDYLAGQLAGAEAAVDPVVRGAVFDRQTWSSIGFVGALSAAQQMLALGLEQPPVSAAALPLWYQSKVQEAVATFLFRREPELFCTRQKRLAQERTERVQAIIRSRYIDPPTLEALAAEVGVSQFYLSRTFSQEMGMTIPQYLRRLRMERAAELLRAGGHNVTEAAFAVGYSSLGHFSKSFCDVIGCCPALYPQALNLLRR